MDALFPFGSFNVASLGSNISAVESGMIQGATTKELGTNWDFLYIMNASSLYNASHEMYDRGARFMIPVFVARPASGTFEIYGITYSYRTNLDEDDISYQYRESSFGYISSTGALSTFSNSDNEYYITYITFRINL